MIELKDIINYVIESCKSTLIRPSEDMILDVSVRIYNSQSFKSGEKKETEKEVVTKEIKKTKPSEKMYYSLINYYGYTEKEVDEMDYQTAYDTIKKEKEIQNKEKNEKRN
jgi:16S rRNA U516 pseudouridylate synthase RsuA-like enzyme